MKKLKPEDFIYMEEKVVHFNECMGNFLDNKNLISTYQKLSYEEVNLELARAIEDKNEVEILDALIDGVFTVFYWSLLNDVENSLKNCPRFLRLVTEERLRGNLNLEFGLLDFILKHKAFEAQTELVMLIFSYQDQFDILGAFNNVYESNMSKFVPKGRLDVDSELKLIESKGRYKDIIVEEVVNGGNVYLAFKAGEDTENNVKFKAPKIIKTSLFVEPELDPYIY